MFRVVAGHTPIAAKTADYSGTLNESSYKSCCSCTRAQRKLNSQFFLRASTNRCVPLRSIIFFVPELNRKEVFFLERKKKRNEKQFVPTPGLEVWRKRDQRSAYSSAMPVKAAFLLQRLSSIWQSLRTPQWRDDRGARWGTVWWLSSRDTQAVERIVSISLMIDSSIITERRKQANPENDSIWLPRPSRNPW